MVLIFFYFFCLTLPLSVRGRNLQIIFDRIDVASAKNYILNETVLYVIEINKIPNDIERAPPRIYVNCEECNENHPLLLIVTQNKGVLSWELPIVIQSGDLQDVYKNMSRTLCPYDISNFISYDVDEKEVMHPVTVALSTSSHQNKVVELSVNLEENFVLQLGDNKSFQVSPSTPSYYLFQYPSENVTSVFLEVNSDDDICLIVSVQNLSCPVFDQEENIAYKGYFQTVTKQGGLTLTRKAFPNGFFVVFVVSNADRYCSSELVGNLHDRNKNVSINAYKSISKEDFFSPISLTILVILLFWAVMFILFFCLINKVEINTDLLRNEPPAISSAEEDANTGVEITEVQPFRHQADLDITALRQKRWICVNDLSRKNEIIVKKKSLVFFKNLIIVAVFYFLPVIQLVFSDQSRVNQFGIEDLCYYNFLCAHPLWLFSDFNHVFSNIGYVAFGILFLILTILKEKTYKSEICTKETLHKNYGIPQQFGLFYAMGIALIVEGIMSACYHICPNYYNFQFDASFMYVICTLCMVKIYQSRHPDISANVYTTFSLLAAVIFIGMFGVFINNLNFWIFFTILHLIVCMYMTLNIYYCGSWKLSKIGISGFCRNLRSFDLKSLKPKYPSRFFLLVLLNAVNWILACLSFLVEVETFSSHLLNIFLLNLILYTAFYIMMKIICKEKLSMQSWILILLSTVCWGPALYFFLSKTVAWKLTPAESKLYNQKCILLNFYDNHDIWHFLSAAAMFFSFMVLLTLDDNLINTRRSRIMAF